MPSALATLPALAPSLSIPLLHVSGALLHGQLWSQVLSRWFCSWTECFALEKPELMLCQRDLLLSKLYLYVKSQLSSCFSYSFTCLPAAHSQRRRANRQGWMYCTFSLSVCQNPNGTQITYGNPNGRPFIYEPTRDMILALHNTVKFIQKTSVWIINLLLF